MEATRAQFPARLESQPGDHHIHQILQEGQPLKNEKKNNEKVTLH